MKTKTLLFLFAAIAALPSFALAQGTYLSAPDNNPTNALVVANGGSVGIGTSFPEAKLQVAGDVRLGLVRDTGAALESPGYGSMLWFSGGPDVSVPWDSENSDPIWMARYNAGDDLSELRINIGDTVGADALVVGNEDNLGGWRPRMTVRMNGTVGIGTPNPQAQLHIEGGYPQLRLSNPGIGSGVEMDFVDVGILRQKIGTLTHSRNLQFATGGTDTNGTGLTPRLTIDENGKIGMGTVSPLTTLDIYRDSTVAMSLRTASQRFDLYNDGSTLQLGDGISSLYLAIQNTGNVGIGTAAPQAKLDVNGKINCTVLELTSDRNVKAGFAPVDCRATLEQVAGLPLNTWHYTNAPAVTHLGPMAQDFQAAFHLGSDDKHIATVDADGVALAAIQGLNEKLTESLQEKDAEIAALKKELHTLKTEQTIFAIRFEKLEKLLVAAEVNPRTICTAKSAPTHVGGYESSAAAR